LTRVLREYGEERFSLRIAQAIARERVTRPFTSTARLADLVRESIPAATRRTGGHPAKRTFQALRIEVNGELAALDGAIPAALDALRVGGRIVVMSYQSLEDRIVKVFFREHSREWIDRPEWPAPRRNPERQFQLLTPHPITASADEIQENPRARSAKLRVVEKL
jgi:16S rRNA (cytosine1402-N4)-methyltransferase